MNYNQSYKILCDIKQWYFLWQTNKTSTLHHFYQNHKGTIVLLRGWKQFCKTKDQSSTVYPPWHMPGLYLLYNKSAKSGSEWSYRMRKTSCLVIRCLKVSRGTYKGLMGWCLDCIQINSPNLKHGHIVGFILYLAREKIKYLNGSFFLIYDINPCYRKETIQSAVVWHMAKKTNF